MIERSRRSISFVLVLAMILAMTCGYSFADTYGDGYKPGLSSWDTSISSVTKFTFGKDVDGLDCLYVHGIAANPGGDVNAEWYRYDGDSYSLVQSGNHELDPGETEFSVALQLPENETTDGYNVIIVSDITQDPYGVDNSTIGDDGKSKSFSVYFTADGNNIRDGWNTLLLDPSADIAVGDVAPATTEAAVGSSVTFNVGAVTTSPGGTNLTPGQTGYTLKYQWKHDGTNIAGATGAAYTIASVAAADAGRYACEVTYTEADHSATVKEAREGVLTIAKADPNLTAVITSQSAVYDSGEEGLTVQEGTAVSSAGAVTYVYSVATVGATGNESLNGAGLPIRAGKYDVTAYSSETAIYKGASVGGITLNVLPADQTLTGTAGQVSIGSTLDLTTCVTGKGAGADLTFRIDDSADSTGAILDPDGKTLKDAATTGAVTVYVSASAVTGKYNASPEISFTVNVNEGEAVTVGAVSTLGGKTYAPGGVRLGDIPISPAPEVTAVNGGATVKGQWSWSAPETTLGAVTAAEQTAVFTPAPAGENNGVVYAGTTVQIPVTVDKAVPALTLTLSPAAVGYGGTAAAIAELSCSTDSSVTLTYTSADTGKATIDTDGNITAVSKGAVNITASYAGDANYQAVSSSAVFTVQAEPDAPALTLTAGDKKLTANWTRPNDNGSEITGYTLLFKYQGVVSTEPAVKYEYGSQSITTTGGIDAIGGYASGGAFYVSEGGIEHLVTTSAAIHEIQGEVTVTKTAVKTATSYTLDPATNDLEYTVSLFATNAIGDGPLSNEAKATPKAGSGGSSGGHGGGGGGSAVTQSYTVEFKAGAHGTLEGKASLSVEKDGKIKNAPEVKADKGYVFLGWSADGKTVIDLSQYKVTGKVTLTALYQKGSGYIEGYADGTFRPDNNMTRAEVATVLAKLSKGFDSEKSYTGEFTDVGSDWYRDFVNYAASNNIFSGYKDGSFRPDNRITRAEFAACLANFMGVSGQGSSSFTDAGGHWAEGYISALKEKGITAGYADNTFRPENQITRAEVVTMLNQALNIKGSGAIAPSDVTKAHWAYEQIISAVNADIGDVLR